MARPGARARFRFHDQHGLGGRARCRAARRRRRTSGRTENRWPSPRSARCRRTAAGARGRERAVGAVAGPQGRRCRDRRPAGAGGDDARRAHAGQRDHRGGGQARWRAPARPEAAAARYQPGCPADGEESGRGAVRQARRPEGRLRAVLPALRGERGRTGLLLGRPARGCARRRRRDRRRHARPGRRPGAHGQSQDSSAGLGFAVRRLPGADTNLKAQVWAEYRRPGVGRLRRAAPGRVAVRLRLGHLHRRPHGQAGEGERRAYRSRRVGRDRGRADRPQRGEPASDAGHREALGRRGPRLDHPGRHQLGLRQVRRAGHQRQPLHRGGAGQDAGQGQDRADPGQERRPDPLQQSELDPPRRAAQLRLHATALSPGRRASRPATFRRP